METTKIRKKSRARNKSAFAFIYHNSTLYNLSCQRAKHVMHSFRRNKSVALHPFRRAFHIQNTLRQQTIRVSKRVLCRISQQTISLPFSSSSCFYGIFAMKIHHIFYHFIAISFPLEASANFNHIIDISLILKPYFIY